MTCPKTMKVHARVVAEEREKDRRKEEWKKTHLPGYYVVEVGDR